MFPPVGVPGALSATAFELHPSITVAEDYTDNFDRRARDKRENFRSSVSPGLLLLIDRPVTQGILSYTLSVTHDTVTDEADLSAHSFLGQVSWQLTPRLSLIATDAFTHSDEPSRADDLGLRTQRETFTSNSFTLVANYLIGNFVTQPYYRLSMFFAEGGDETISHVIGGAVTTRLGELNTVSAGYEYLMSRTGDEVERTGHQFNASLVRQLTPFVSAGVSGAYAFRTVEEDDRDGRDYQIWGVALSAEYFPPGQLSLRGSVGFSRLMPDEGSDRSVVTASATLAYQFLAGGGASLTLTRGFSETFSSGEDFGVVETQGVVATVSYPLRPAIIGHVSGFYRENKTTSASRAREDLSRESWGGNVGLSIGLLRWLSLGLDYFYTEQTAAARARAVDGGGVITENRARVSLTAAF